MRSSLAGLLLALSILVRWTHGLSADRSQANDCYRTVGYWGQNTLYVGTKANEDSLANYCSQGNFDIIVVGFVHIHSDGNPPLPGLNFAYHCEEAPIEGYPYLLQCPEIGGIFHSNSQNIGIRIIFHLL
jgi:hypothetical protein